MPKKTIQLQEREVFDGNTIPQLQATGAWYFCADCVSWTHRHCCRPTCSIWWDQNCLMANMEKAQTQEQSNRNVSLNAIEEQEVG
jgi:hypothetical protein